MGLGPNDSVRIVNVGDQQWSDMFGGVQYRINPGGEAFVPFPAVCLWFGHPDAVDIDPRNRHRTDEVARLRTKYGVYEHTVVPESRPDLGEIGTDAWENVRPRIDVYALTGEKLVMVMDDPDGTNVTPAQLTIAEQQSSGQMLATMQAQMAEMQREIARLRSQEDALADGGAVGEDTDPTAPVVASPPAPPAPASGAKKVTGGTVKKVSGSGGAGKPKATASNGGSDVTEDSPGRVPVG